VFENTVLRRLFGTNRNEVTSEWRRLHDGELNGYSSRNIVRLIKSRRIRKEGIEVRMVERRVSYRVLVEKPE
jgi:hypothetical protein